MGVIDMETLEFEETGTAATSATQIGDEINLDGNFKEAIFEVENAGAVALTQFTLEVQAHPNAQWVTWITDTAWASAAGLVRLASALKTLGATSKATVAVYLPVAHKMRFKATVGSSTAAVTVRGKIWR